MSLGKSQLLLIAGGVVLIVLLIMLPRQNASVQTEKRQEKGSSMQENSELALTKFSDSLSVTLAKSNPGLNKLQENFKKDPGNKFNSDTLVNWLTVNNQQVLAAIYSYEAANSLKTEKSWEIAGNRLFNASQFAKPEVSSGLINKSISALEQCLKLNPSNLKAKTILGSCYVSGSQEPMKGIGLLREVLNQDSTYIEAHLKLAMFAVQSQQYDKAIDRFQKILRIDPEFIEAYLYIGEVYASMNEKQKAIENLELFKAKSNDAVVINEVDKYIRELKNK